MSKSKRKKTKKHGKSCKSAKSDNPLFVGIITKEQQLKMEKHARRQSAVEAGEYTRSGAGSGAHGGDKHQQARKERRNAKLSLTKELE